MSIALHTRSVCDECCRPAVLSDGGAFLCEICDQRINGAVENSDSSASSPDGYAAVSTSSPSPIEAAATLSVDPGPYVWPDDIEAEIARLEAQWRREGISMNSSTLRVVARNETSA